MCRWMAGRKLSSALPRKVALARRRRKKSSSCIGAQLNHRRSNAQQLRLANRGPQLKISTGFAYLPIFDYRLLSVA
jgi:hypothetical protein